jgi:hypothetical protein
MLAIWNFAVEKLLITIYLRYRLCIESVTLTVFIISFYYNTFAPKTLRPGIKQ